MSHVYGTFPEEVRRTRYDVVNAFERAVVSELLRTTLKNMNMMWPPLDSGVDPDEARRRLG